MAITKAHRDYEKKIYDDLGMESREKPYECHKLYCKDVPIFCYVHHERLLKDAEQSSRLSMLREVEKTLNNVNTRGYGLSYREIPVICSCKRYYNFGYYFNQERSEERCMDCWWEQLKEELSSLSHPAKEVTK